MNDYRKQHFAHSEGLYHHHHPSHYDSYLTYSSSPPRSSSPVPSTPCLERHGRDWAYIRSSPDFYPNVMVKERLLDCWSLPEEPSSSSSSSWRGDAMYNYPPRSASICTTDEFPPTSDYDPFESSQDSWNGTRRNEFSSSGSYSVLPDKDDSEEEQDFFEFGDNPGYRTTYFRTSAERGLWKNDAKAIVPGLLSTRKSVSMLSLSRLPTPTVVNNNNTRTVSEPAPSSSNIEKSGFFVQERVLHPPGSLAEDEFAVQPQPLPHPRPSSSSSNYKSINAENSSRISNGTGAITHCVPSSSTNNMDVDMDVEVESEEHGFLSSPLPPSSPLPLSPMTQSISILSRSSSVLSFVHERSSSPLSELSDDDDDNKSGDIFGLDKGITKAMISDDLPDLEQDDENVAECSSPPHKVQLLSPLTGSEILSPFLSGMFCKREVPIVITGNGVVSHEPSGTNCNGTSGPANVALSSCDEVEKHVPSNLEVGHTAVDSEDKLSRDDRVNRVRKSESEKSNSGALKEKNGIVRRPSVFPLASSSRASSVVPNDRERGDGKRKKRKVDLEVEVKASRNTDDKKLMKGKKRAARDDEEDVENDESSRNNAATAAPKHKRRKKAVSSKATKQTTATMTKPKRRGGRGPSVYDDEDEEYSEPLDAEAKELHATICGMVIETMATSRASSLPVSSLFKLVMSSQPSLKSERTEQDWLRIFERVLHDGEEGRGSGVFAKVESSGKDEATNRPLEAQWFYVPERDEDQERAALIRSMMPRPGKRTETMKYKQYYWRPLGKISKWDPEDAD